MRSAATPETRLVHGTCFAEMFRTTIDHGETFMVIRLPKRNTQMFHDTAAPQALLSCAEPAIQKRLLKDSDGPMVDRLRTNQHMLTTCIPFSPTNRVHHNIMSFSARRTSAPQRQS